ncbi:MAG: prepilin-type N-terminal cleavage/methylation domain-containing protein [Rickettsiales bacterium]
MRQYRNPSKGFTLIELSIVLVIIGLIISGVLVGNYLIKAAELRAIYKQKEDIVAAINTFKLKYNYLPGDLPDATSYFGTNPAGCPAPTASPQTNSTCNGNGNGIIDEVFTVWQQLAAANLIKGFYRGTQASNGSPAYDSTSMPAIAGSDNTWYLEHTNVDSWNGFELYQRFRNQHMMVSTRSFGYGSPQLLTPAEMFSFDKKYDDGKPASGNIQVLSDWQLDGCTNPQSKPAPNAVYDTTKLDKNCDVVFLNLGF